MSFICNRCGNCCRWRGIVRLRAEEAAGFIDSGLKKRVGAILGTPMKRAQITISVFVPPQAVGTCALIAAEAPVKALVVFCHTVDVSSHKIAAGTVPVSAAHPLKRF